MIDLANDEMEEPLNEQYLIMDYSIGGECCEYLTTRCRKLVFNIQDCEYLTNGCGRLVLTNKPVNT